MSPAEAAPAFLLDRMLHRLARVLRAAGYDAASVPEGARDRDIAAQALAEGRVIVTRDGKLAEVKAARGRLVVLAAAGLAAEAEELTARCGIDWLRDPMSRCLLCDRPVEAADPARDWPAGRPFDPGFAPLTRCRPCGKLYWRGGHVRRLLARLERWRSGRFDEPDRVGREGRAGPSGGGRVVS